MFNVLQERGVPSRFLNFPDENHWYVSEEPLRPRFLGQVLTEICRVLKQENSLVWHQQMLGWLNRYSGIEEANPDAVSLDDTIIPVVNYNP